MSLPPNEQALADAIGQVLVEEIERAVAPLRLRIAELEQRGVEYAGVFQRAQGYRRGSICTHDNNLFVAIKNTEPGEIPLQHSSWQLCLRGATQERRVPTRQNGVRA